MSSAVVAVTPSILFNSVASADIFVPPISNVVAEISPATVTIPDAKVMRSASPETAICPPFTTKSPAIVVVDAVGSAFPVTVT